MNCASYYAFELFPPPALGKRCHRGLARYGVAVDRRAVFVVAMDQRAAIFSAQLMQTPARSNPQPVQLQLDL
jgi:hypothetical protein